MHCRMSNEVSRSRVLELAVAAGVRGALCFVDSKTYIMLVLVL